MVRFLKLPVATIAVYFAMNTVALSDSPQQMVQRFAGTWTCVTHDSMHKTWRETDVSTIFGPWIRTQVSSPAQNGMKAATGTDFFGYDSSRKRWTFSNFSTDGSYFESYSSSPSFDGAVWKMAYPAGPLAATSHMSSANQYSMDWSGPGPNGHTVTGHQVCTRTL